VWATLLSAALFGAVMYAIRPRLEWLFRLGNDPRGPVAASILFALSTAALTEALGLHVALGSFLAGAIIPQRSELIDPIVEGLSPVTDFFLLPLFFAYTGLRTQMGLVRGFELWLPMCAILVSAVVGKLGGCTIAGRFSGSSWREALAIGALMNSRGLMELVALNIGLDSGIISPALFSMMVMMTLVTTLMTSPLLTTVYGELSRPCLSGSSE